MYSPKIPERFIPTLHHLSRLRGRPMTTVVAEAIQQYVARQDLAPIAEQIAASERRFVGRAAPRPTPPSDVARP
jgi:predicted transcriptional regulator